MRNSMKNTNYFLYISKISINFFNNRLIIMQWLKTINLAHRLPVSNLIPVQFSPPSAFSHSSENVKLSLSGCATTNWLASTCLTSRDDQGKTSSYQWNLSALKFLWKQNHFSKNFLSKKMAEGFTEMWKWPLFDYIKKIFWYSQKQKNFSFRKSLNSKNIYIYIAYIALAFSLVPYLSTWQTFFFWNTGKENLKYKLVSFQ